MIDLELFVSRTAEIRQTITVCLFSSEMSKKINVDLVIMTFVTPTKRSSHHYRIN